LQAAIEIVQARTGLGLPPGIHFTPFTGWHICFDKAASVFKPTDDSGTSARQSRSDRI
jgi:hypothetical protein